MIRKPLGPGPGAYTLPSTFGYNKHDARKTRLPQYSFGIRLHGAGRMKTPGPKYNFDHITRFGIDRGRAFTLYPRLERKVISRGPGPGAHDVVEHPVLKSNKPPAYSLSGRDYFQYKKYTPAPNNYKINVDPIKPRSLAYSMGGRSTLSQHPTSPGPATYGRTNLNVKLPKAPEYSMKPRLNYHFKKCSPSPNAYNLINYSPGDSSQKYSFGIKHNIYAPPLILPCDNI